MHDTIQFRIIHLTTWYLKISILQYMKNLSLPVALLCVELPPPHYRAMCCGKYLDLSGIRRLYCEGNCMRNIVICSPCQILCNQYDGWQVQHAFESRHIYRVLTGKLEGNRPLVKARPWWGGKMRQDFKQVKMILNLPIPQNAETFLTSEATISYSQKNSAPHS